MFMYFNSIIFLCLLILSNRRTLGCMATICPSVTMAIIYNTEFHLPLYISLMLISTFKNIWKLQTDYALVKAKEVPRYKSSSALLKDYFRHYQ